MSLSAILMMIGMLGGFWGGFVALLVWTLRHDGGHTTLDPTDTPAVPSVDGTSSRREDADSDRGEGSRDRPDRRRPAGPGA